MSAKIPVCIPLPLTVLSACGLPISPLRMYPSSIRHCSMVWQCNSWCSQNTLLIGGLIFGSCKQPHTGSQTHVGLLVPSANPYYNLWHKSYKMNNDLQFILRHHP